MEHFTNYVAAQREPYPVLRTVLRLERRLECIEAMADILAWHRVIFKVGVPIAHLARKTRGCRH